MVAVITPPPPPPAPSGTSAIPVSTVAASGATQALAFPTAGDAAFDITLSASCTVSLSGGTAGLKQTLTARYKQPSSGGYVVSYGTAIQWPFGSAPTPNTTASRYDVIEYLTFGDGVYFGSAVGLGIAAPSLSVIAPAGTTYAGNSMAFTGSYTGSTPTGIDYMLDNSGTWTTSTSTIANGGYSFSITAPAAGSHTLAVRETNANGIAASVPIAISAASAPAAPVLSAASTSSGSVSIPWASGAANGSAITSQEMMRSTSTGTEVNYMAVTGTSPFVDSSAANGTTYFYEMTSTNGIGTSAVSNEISATPAAAVTGGNHVLNVAGGYASTPDAAALRAASSLLDVKIKCAPASWKPSATAFLLSKWGSATSGQEWVLFLSTTGAIEFNWRPSTSAVETTIAAAPGFTDGTPMWLRAVVNPSATASGSYAAGSTTLMTSADGTTWTTLTNTSGNVSTSPIQGTTSPVSIAGNGSNLAWTGTAYHATVSVGGTVVNDIDLTNQTTAATTLTATTGGNWTVTSPANES